jgi:hypothetical protein
MTKTQIAKAFAALQAIGAPAFNHPDWFVISGEDNYDKDTHEYKLWARADLDFMHPDIEAILKKNGLAYEWYDGGTAKIFAA